MSTAAEGGLTTEVDEEMAMTAEELRSWIRERVQKMPLISPAVLENCNILQSLLERRERQAARLLKLCESLAECEENVKKQYALLGWEYPDRDSDNDDDGDEDDEELTGCEDRLSSPCESVHSDHAAPVPIMTGAPFPQLRKQDFHQTREEVILSCLSQKRKAVVVLSRLPDYDSVSAPADQAAKRQKTGRISRPRTLTWACAQRRLKKMSSLRASVETERTETCKLSVDSEARSTLCKPEMRKDPVNVRVLARRRDLDWQWGRIKEIVEKESGKLKYKVCFEEKGKVLVSGHHIAFDVVPELNQLPVGSRVVVRCENNKFMPGIVAEFPSDTNRSRFLIFTDDHTSVYVSLHHLRLVFQPLLDPLDDLLDPAHKAFMQEYLNSWPSCPPDDIHYKVGQTVGAEVDGVQQKCEVTQVDCSLIQVAFQNAHKEWIYRGSMRLQHLLL